MTEFPKPDPSALPYFDIHICSIPYYAIIASQIAILTAVVLGISTAVALIDNEDYKQEYDSIRKTLDVVTEITSG